MVRQTLNFLHHLAVLCLCGLWMAPALGQTWDRDIEIGALGGVEWNVFHSPETYVTNDGTVFPTDSIVLHDQLTLFDIEVDFDREDDNGEWHIQADAGASRYATLSSANRRSIDLRVGREQTLNRQMTASAEARLRDEKRLGINILGDELLTSFSFTQAQLEGALEVEARDNLALDLEVEVFRKWFDQRVTGVSLDQTEWSISLESSWVPKRRRRGLLNLDLVGEKRIDESGELTTELSYRQKNYANWVNFDILDPARDPLAPTPFLPFDSLYAHPLRQWTYATLTVRYEWPEWRGWSLRVDARTQRRNDLSFGDFGYVDAKSALRLAHEGKDLELAGSLSYTWREYTDRLAEQQSPAPFPLLKYNYIRLDLSAEYRLKKGLLLLAMADFTQRTSNTTAIDRRTRREYATAMVLVGLSAEFN